MCKYCGNSEKGWIEKAWNDRDKTMYAHQIRGEMIKLNAGKKHKQMREEDTCKPLREEHAKMLR